MRLLRLANRSSLECEKLQDVSNSAQANRFSARKISVKNRKVSRKNMALIYIYIYIYIHTHTHTDLRENVDLSHLNSTAEYQRFVNIRIN
jgi:hypothetical protein